ncbi:MAG: ABC transporter substrate-binding protein [Chloroflexi bacterium]|nr:ABC transporter substrate-binding protein [Chloroflexota bacterium]
MFSRVRILFLIVGLGTLLFLMACRAAAPTATPVPPTPTKAPAPTIAPAPTVAPAPAATIAPAPTVAPTATTAPLAALKVPNQIKTLLTKFPNVKWYTELALPTTQPKYGGTYVRSGASAGSTGAIPHWDARTSYPTIGSGGGMCYGGLLRYVSDRYNSRITPVPLPDAAESWKQLDALTWEFKLYPNAYWHNKAPVNGRRVTAEDVKWGIEQLRDNSIYAGAFNLLKEVQIKDPQTIVIKTSEPYAHMLNLLAGNSHVFTAPEMDKEPGGAKTWCVGFGPFQLVAWESNGPWALERHPKYHVKGHTGVYKDMQLPFFDRVEVVPFPDAATQIAAFISGKITALIIFGIGDAEKTLSTGGATLAGMAHPNHPGCNNHLALRLDTPPLNDVRVRRALSMSIDRQAIIDTALQGAGYASQFVPIDALGWDTPPFLAERGKYLQFNPAEAKRLLAEAGYPNGFKTSIEISSAQSGWTQNLIETVPFQWKQNLGVEATLKPLEALTLNGNLYSRKYEAMTQVGCISPSSNWDSYTFGTMNSKSVGNWYSINDPEIDRLTVAQRTTFNLAEQRKIYKQIFDLIEENTYRLDLIQAYIFTLWSTRLENANSGLYPWHNSFAGRSTETAWFKN